MKIVQVQILAASLLLLASCETASRLPASGPAGAFSPDDELHQASVEQDRLFNSGETTRLAALYAEDAISMPPNAPTIRGRQALLADFKNFLDVNTKSRKDVGRIRRCQIRFTIGETACS